MKGAHPSLTIMTLRPIVSSIIDEHISNMTVTEEEIRETERPTRGQSKKQLWFDKRRSLLTASNFGKAAKTFKVETLAVKSTSGSINCTFYKLPHVHSTKRALQKLDFKLHKR